MRRPKISRQIPSIIRNALAEQLHTAIPATIETYDFKTQKASVLPVIRLLLEDGREIPYPVIAEVPVVWPRGENCSLTMPLRRGNGGLVVFSEQALENWLRRGGVQTPGAPRQFDLTDAIFIPGCYPFTTPSNAENNDDVLLMHGDDKIRLKPDGIEMQRNASRFAMTDTGIRLECDTLELYARNVWKWDLDGYGETRVANGGGSYTFNTHTIGATVNSVSFSINPPEHDPELVKL